jgi:hypothetical protein
MRPGRGKPALFDTEADAIRAGCVYQMDGVVEEYCR